MSACKPPLSPLASPVLLPTPLPSPSPRKPALKSAMRRAPDVATGEPASWASSHTENSESAPARLQTFDSAARARAQSTSFRESADSILLAAAASAARSARPPRHRRAESVSAAVGPSPPAALALARAQRRRPASPPPRGSSPPPPVPPLPASLLSSGCHGATIITRARRVSRVTPILLATPPSTPPATPPMGTGMPLVEQDTADRIADIIDLYVHSRAQTPTPASPGVTCTQFLGLSSS